MPDKTLPPVVATLYLLIVAAALSVFAQFGTLLMVEKRFRPAPVQILGSLMVSFILGGSTTALLQEGAHVNSFVAGAIGTLTGLIPAAVGGVIITRRAMQQFKLTPADLNDTSDMMRRITTPNDQGGSNA